MLILPIIACIFCVVCLGPYRSAVHLLLALVVFLFGWPWPCDLVLFPPEAAGFFLLLLLFPGFGVVVASSLVCSGGLGACGVTCSFLSSPLPSPLVVLWCFLVQSVLLVPPSGYLVVFTTVRLSYLWHGVSWLLARVFPPLHGNKGFGPLWGFALSTMLWVLFMCPRCGAEIFASGDPESPLNTAKAARAYLGLCCLLLPASAAFLGVRSFLFASLRLPASPRAPAMFGLACLPRCPLS